MPAKTSDTRFERLEAVVSHLLHYGQPKSEAHADALADTLGPGDDAVPAVTSDPAANPNQEHES